MYRLLPWIGASLMLVGLGALGACGDDTLAPAAPGSGGSASGAAGTAGSSAVAGSSAGGSAGSSAGGSAGSSGAGGAGGATGGAGASGAGAGGAAGGGGTAGAPSDVCGDAVFCEKFDGYPAVTNMTNNQKFGPWRAALNQGASMNLEGTHKISGEHALHVHIDGQVEAGGRLFAEGQQPIFANQPTHLYGRMMMYIDPNGSSVHWTFFGVNGKAEPSSPVAGENGGYIMSSLQNQMKNYYSFVYGRSAQDGYHDCSSRAKVEMPKAAWSCIAFEMDSVARKLRMYKDGVAEPILSIDDHGTGCVPPTNVNDPWYGPAVESLFVGAWSFHPMNAPLDVWIDDLVVDTKPVTCPPP